MNFFNFSNQFALVHRDVCIKSVNIMHVVA